MKNNTLQPELVQKSLTKQEFLNNITIKKYSECKGRDGIAFSADIYYKGKFVCDIVESGYGGELDINTYTEIERVNGNIEWAYDYTIHAIFDTINKDELLRVTDMKNKDGSFYSYTMDLEALICTAVDKYCLEKENQKIFRQGIIIESEKGSWEKEGAYRCISWGKKSIKSISSLDYMIPKVQEKINELLNQNKTIINKDYLMSLGFSF